MCTAITYTTKGHYFGRNLDLEGSFGETVTITPRNFPLPFRAAPHQSRHYAIIGMAHTAEGYPLYYDAVNETGLAMAGLNFPGFACYHPQRTDRDSIAPFECIPWVLGQCATLDEARKLLAHTDLLALDFSPRLPRTPLHWMLADRTGSLVVEPLQDGLRLLENPVGVLTNAPPFDFHLNHLCGYRNLTREVSPNNFSADLDLPPYSRGMGAIGLPGDPSSASRFVRAAFTRLNAVSGDSEAESVNQFFHILGSVEQQRGCVHLGHGAYEITLYSCCCNLDRGIYYYTTYENRQITAVDLHREDLDAASLISYPLQTAAVFDCQN
ncbi:MAG: choloylglycine hydrolase family protein [Ruminococcaceae bacterium]|nr:choloylglycine hydrolase family protein [Oscillospiraceae bacterium]